MTKTQVRANIASEKSGSGHNRKKASRFALLGMLSLGENKSGYDLKKAIAATTAYFWSESYGNIYPALRDLVEEGLIRPHGQRAGKTKRRRQLYSITARGRDSLAVWLQQPASILPQDNELLLKLFFGSMIPVKTAQELVSAHRDQHLKLLKDFVNIERSIADGTLSEQQKTYLRFTVDYGRAVSQALVAWAGTTINALERLDAKILV